jgi:small subunit ribosomal protein S18
MGYERERDNYRDRDNLSDRGKPKRKMFTRKKACRFCTDKDFKADYKNPKLLSAFVSERAKIVPRRISGACALHQRDLTTAIKQARLMALLPFTTTQR